MKKRAVVVCPGRGTYNKTELGYIHQNFPDKAKEMLAKIEAYRLQNGHVGLLDLDARPKFERKTFYQGVNSAGLIYACSYLDFHSIDQEAYDIVGVTGNSMGWYTACQLAGALEHSEGIRLTHTLASLTAENQIGAQLIYPQMNEDWTCLSKDVKGPWELAEKINSSLKSQALHLSINFGGYIVIGGEKEAVLALQKALPVKDIYPLVLPGNSAFHTPMMSEVSQRAMEALKDLVFKKPATSLIDGRGKIWSPFSTNQKELASYTLEFQVTRPYDFSKAIETCEKELSPDVYILLGPGSGSGGAVAQTLIRKELRTFKTKSEFLEDNASIPVILSMGLDKDRVKVEGPS